MTPPPRLYGLVATAAPVALIFRRGPSNWFHLVKWNLADGSIEPGGWARKKIFPRRCDIDPSGWYLSFYIAGGFQRGYSILAGISRLPWLHPLADSEELDSTYHRGYHFVKRGQASGPFKDTPIKNLVLESSGAVSFANERRRGWTEAPECPPRSPNDAWDEHRMIVLEKQSPHGSALLRMNASPGSSPGHVEYWTCDYALTWPGQTVRVSGATWAEWAPDGRLAIATDTGLLRLVEAQDTQLVTRVEHDLTKLAPDPQPPPEWSMTA